MATEALEALRGSAFDVEVRSNFTSVFHVPNADDATECMMRTFAAWGRRAPIELWDGSWLEKVAEHGHYTAEADSVQVRARPARF